MFSKMDQKIEQILYRGTVDINIKEDLERKLQSGKKLRIKFGIDPTGSELHIGHLVALRKLRQFQELGHHIILLFGTFTGKIGDPTGKDALRVPLTDEQIHHNMKSYLDQVSCVLDMQNIEVVKNHEWLSNMNFSQVLELAGTFTASQMIQRDMFQKRLKNKQDINLVEFFYPLMQGYDSVAIRADVEIGGTDQLFNLMAGRKVQERFGLEPQNILTTPILEGIAGKEKMSKSLKNYIAISDSPRDVFGKVMSIPDHLIWKYLELLTDVPRKHITEWITQKHPRDAKIVLAEHITTMLHSSEQAMSAQEEFFRMFVQKGLPDDIPSRLLPQGEYSILDIVILSRFCASNSDARRIILQGGVQWNNEKIMDLDVKVTVDSEEKVLQVGKKYFLRIQGK
jgi:tyrosyl-tRNA synthetase